MIPPGFLWPQSLLATLPSSWLQDLTLVLCLGGALFFLALAVRDLLSG